VTICRIAALLAIAFTSASAAAFDEAAPPGANYAKAEFRLWYPDSVTHVRAVVVLMPGSNGDGRPAADDPAWQAFARRLDLALIGCRFTDKPHDQNFIEEYVRVADGSGQDLLDTLGVFARRIQPPELATAPLLLWGMSAGGQFNYEFTAWKPERVMAFVVNKGGIYYTALTSRAARSVPGMLFTGEKDLESRIQTITGLFAVNRRAGALWAIAEEPAAAHIVGRSRDMALIFYEDVLRLRLGDQTEMRPMPEAPGFVGDPKSKTFHAVADGPLPAYPSSWLPTARVARAWQALVTGSTFEQ